MVVKKRIRSISTLLAENESEVFVTDDLSDSHTTSKSMLIRDTSKYERARSISIENEFDESHQSQTIESEDAIQVSRNRSTAIEKRSSNQRYQESSE